MNCLPADNSHEISSLIWSLNTSGKLIRASWWLCTQNLYRNFWWSLTVKGAQWLSGRVLDSRLRGRGLKPQRRHCVVSLSKAHLSLLRTGSTQEGPSRHNWKIVDWDVKNQTSKKFTVILNFVKKQVSSPDFLVLAWQIRRNANYVHIEIHRMGNFPGILH